MKCPPCPSCGCELKTQELLWRRAMPSLEVWCAIGSCPSKAANTGAEGATIAEAYERLCDLVEKEQCEHR